MEVNKPKSVEIAKFTPDEFYAYGIKLLPQYLKNNHKGLFDFFYNYITPQNPATAPIDQSRVIMFEGELPTPREEREDGPGLQFGDIDTSTHTISFCIVNDDFKLDLSARSATFNGQNIAGMDLKEAIELNPNALVLEIYGHLCHFIAWEVNNPPPNRRFGGGL